MSTDLHLSFDALDVIAPFALLISPDGTLLRIGPSLTILADDARVGDPLFTRFRSATAGMTEVGTELDARVGTLVALEHRRTAQRVRGPLVRVQGDDALLFVATPVFETAEQLAASGLTELDFAPGDQTFEAFARLAAMQPARAVAPDGLIDGVQLERLTGIPGQNRPTLAGDLLEVFTARFAACVEAVREAGRSGDPERVRHEAHAFKGSALTVGAAGVGLLCGLIEDDAREGRLGEIADRCARIESLWAESAPFLWQIVERRGPR